MGVQVFDRRIRAGATFLYRPEGTESQVFEVRMKRPVTETHLFTACRLAFKRYPYFACKLRLHDDGNYYLDKSPAAPIPQRRRKLRPLGSVSTQYNIMDITFHGRSIYVSFHHGMCDGMGVMPFIKTMLFYYLTAEYPNRKFAVPGLRCVGDPLLPGEMDDPVVKGNFEVDPLQVYHLDGRGGYKLPEVMTGQQQYCRWEISLDEKEYIAKCRENGCSATVFAALMFQRAVRRVHPEAVEPVVGNIVCDWRKTLEVPNTFRNCVSCVPLLYSKTDEALPLPEVGARNRKAFDRQREKNSARAAAAVVKMLSDQLEALPDYESRAQLISRISGFVNDTFTMSYLGRADFGDMEAYVDELHVYTSGDTGVALEMIALGGRMTIDLKQSFLSDAYCKALVAELADAGLAAACSQRIEFEIPKDTSRKLSLFERITTGLQRRVANLLR